MHASFRPVQKDALLYYVSDRLPVRHAFTTKFGGVSAGDCESLNLGFNRGDLRENVLKNYEILAEGLGVDHSRMTLTHQVHRDEVSIVTEETVGMGLHKPMAWESDAIVTNLPDTPLCGFYADCVVTLLCDPKNRVCGVSHAGWRGTAAAILDKTVQKMELLGADRREIIAVLGPSIGQCCFETDADVPTAMEAELGAFASPFIEMRGPKWHIDLRGLNAAILARAGLAPENIIDSGICTYCESETFWSHRATQGKRGVQAAVISL